MRSEIAQSCVTLCEPIDCSLPGSYLSGIFQARVLEWVDISFSRGSSWPGGRTQVSCIAGRCFTLWATREALCFHDDQWLIKHIIFPVPLLIDIRTFLCVCELCSQIICPLKNLFMERTRWQRSRWVRSTSSLWIHQEYTFRYRSAWQTGVPEQWKRIYRAMQTHQQQPSPWDCSTIPKLQLPSAVPSRGPAFLSRRSSPEPLESEHWFQDPRLPGN